MLLSHPHPTLLSHVRGAQLDPCVRQQHLLLAYTKSFFSSAPTWPVTAAKGEYRHFPSAVCVPLHVCCMDQG